MYEYKLSVKWSWSRDFKILLAISVFLEYRIWWRLLINWSRVLSLAQVREASMIAWFLWWIRCSPFTSSSKRPAPTRADRPPAPNRGHRPPDRRPGLRALRRTEEEIWIVEASACNPQDHPSFWHSLNKPYFRFWQSPYSKTMEWFIDNCHLSKKQHRLEPNYGPTSQIATSDLMRSRHIYKMYESAYGLDEHIFKYVQLADRDLEL